MAATDGGVRSMLARKTVKKSDGEQWMDYVNSEDGLIAKVAVQKAFRTYDPEKSDRNEFDRLFNHAYNKARNTGVGVAGLRLRSLLYYWYGRLQLDSEW